MRNLVVAKFTGEDADRHRLPAYEAVQSLYGISRSLLIVTNYLVEGRVRRKDFSLTGFEFNIVTQRPGSFETVFEIISDPRTMDIVSTLGMGVAGNFLTDFIKSIINQTVGNPSEPIVEQLVADEKLKSGDLLALSDAIEPAMRTAHRSIGCGASQVFIITGDHNSVKLDSSTKRYVNTSIPDQNVFTKLFSVSSFNANSGDGRAFDLEEGRSVPFKLEPSVDRATINTILGSMTLYARKRKLGDNLSSSVAFQYKSTLSIDGKVKKINLIKARQNLGDL